MCPRSGFRSGGTCEFTLVPVFVLGEHPTVPSFQFSLRGNTRQNHPFGKPRFCEPAIIYGVTDTDLNSFRISFGVTDTDLALIIAQLLNDSFPTLSLTLDQLELCYYAWLKLTCLSFWTKEASLP